MKLWLYWTMGQHMVAGWWAEFWSSLANAPHCSGSCNGARRPCNCSTGKRSDPT
jgi:hypothetical protein